MTRPLIVLTRIWPRPDRPSLGSFVRDRVAAVPDLRVVKPPARRIPRVLIYARLLLDALRVGPIRGVEAHMLTPTGFIGLIVARVRGVPLVVYAHGMDVWEWQRPPLPVRWLGRYVARHADRLVTNSEETARDVRVLGGAEPIVAPPGVDLSRFRPSPRPTERRVLYLGGDDPRKGYQVASGLADTLVGPGLDELEPERIPALIAAHDVVLVPSLAEPFGLVAVEAIASGRWVVANAVGGLRDIVIDGVNGTLVDDGDFEGALARVPDYDPDAVAATAQRFSLRAWQAALARIWTEVLASR
ncbi:MAG: glycosyltransferase [Chloroflexi bacterium]|nr:glycosyltransferase [Chloroflexota bacterium]